ncbi:MAG: PQQ-binding-like beta-propeller repeat protein, partial [Kiritimatiellaeota bacterium]|nr:PQQ-binding-like beta-propeller repeat protein [Kiritimatiellota bacterium]
LALNLADGAVVWTNRSAKEISWSSPIEAEIVGRPVAIVQSSVAVLAVSLSDGKTIWRTECLSGEVAPSPSVAGARVFTANANASAVALDLATGKKLWENEDVDLPDVASVLATDAGRVYLAANFGPLTCLDAATGKVLWVHEFDSGFYSTPILVGDLIYLTDLKGRTRIIKDASEFKLVHTSEIGESCFCTPVFSNDSIFIRGVKRLFKISAPQ